MTRGQLQKKNGKSAIRVVCYPVFIPADSTWIVLNRWTHIGMVSVYTTRVNLLQSMMLIAPCRTSYDPPGLLSPMMGENQCDERLQTWVEWISGVQKTASYKEDTNSIGNRKCRSGSRLIPSCYSSYAAAVASCRPVGTRFSTCFLVQCILLQDTGSAGQYSWGSLHITANLTGQQSWKQRTSNCCLGQLPRLVWSDTSLLLTATSKTNRIQRRETSCEWLTFLHLDWVKWSS